MLKICVMISLFVSSVVLLPIEHHGKKHGHSRVKLENCDDTINGISIDWDGDDDYRIPRERYECTNNSNEKSSKRNEIFAKEYCVTAPVSYHVCLNEKLVYNESVPLGGPHRPVWVTYGEYLYMPPQRWIHAIEHGAAAFLYDPCAPEKEIKMFKKLAKTCLRRHIITPYKSLPNNELFNIVTFGCHLKMNQISGNENSVVDYLRRHAIQDGPEFPLSEDGDYKFGLVEKAKLISDMDDSNICPFAPLITTTLEAGLDQEEEEEEEFVFQ